ncbi:SHOCT domain-containing protein [Ornithinimicrobium sp. F0845]|uniref:SHOCT domain-containing protein n=1 Tax=Ornithinimicrobium sp. F0845 TaxID=2926412 RepID=UPI001FF1768B|nr:SHOCT domain-containing protein [Ornithinimicrobium sp. F0845]MCK0113578.1 SHOCT domain-containing protein [Ornithinimicrobium sp. F0845]
MLMRRPVRVGRPGLIGTAARTAVIAGTASAVSGNVARRQQARSAQAQEAQAYEAQQAAAAAAPPPQAAPPQPAAPAGPDVIAELERLGALKSQGILTEAEFEAQKARILGS